MGRIAAWSRRHDLALYVGLAFLISWATWPLVALNPNSSPLVPFGPLLAASAVALLTGGARELRRLMAQLGRWRQPPLWYAIALAGPPALTFMAAALAVALGAHPSAASTPDWPGVLGSFLTTLVLVGLFEEVGWRGYALPRLQRRHSGLRAAGILGVIWGLWHLPELLSDPDGQRPVAPFLVFVLAQSVILSWLYNSTHASLPIVMLSHAATNTAAYVVLPMFTEDGYQLVWWILTELWVTAAAFVTALAGTRLATEMPKPADPEFAAAHPDRRLFTAARSLDRPNCT